MIIITTDDNVQVRKIGAYPESFYALVLGIISRTFTRNYVSTRYITPNYPTENVTRTVEYLYM